jgi:hypothetical protein
MRRCTHVDATKSLAPGARLGQSNGGWTAAGYFAATLPVMDAMTPDAI